MHVSFESLGALELGWISIECTQRQMPCLVRDLEYQTVGESQSCTLLELSERADDNFHILNRQLFMFEQHLQQSYKLSCCPIIDRVEHPHSLRHTRSDTGHPAR